MIEEMKDKLRKQMVDYGEIHVEVRTSNKIVYSKDNIETVTTAKTSSGNARILDKGGWGFASFNDLDFDKNLDKAILNSRLVGERTSEKIDSIALDGKAIVAEVKTDFSISPQSYSLAQKNEIVRRYNEGLKDAGITATKVTYADWKVEKYLVNSLGSAIKQELVFTGISYGAMAKDGTNVQHAFESVGQYGGMELVLGLEESVEKVKKRAMDLLKAKKIEAGQYKCLLDTTLAGVFVHEAFGHLSESDFLSDNPKMREVMVLGRQFGPEILNIVDDGSLVNLAGYTPYDDEGIPADRTYLIKGGKLNARLHSRETAKKMGESPSGNARALTAMHQPIVRMTNTFIDNGNQSFDDLIASIDDGIYAIDYLGGMTNLEMFTFSSGYAYRIKNGKIGELLRDVVLSGNVFSTLHNIVGVGNDLRHHGGLGGCGKGGQSGLPVGTGSPHIVVKDVLVGGV